MTKPKSIQPEVKKWTFYIYEFDESTGQVKISGKYKTKPMTKESLKQLIKKERATFKGVTCWGLE
jgi:hypothetical protein